VITENQYIESAKELGVETAVIKAVSEVESSGDGFLESGEPKILFEPHVFWKQLKSKGINPADHVKGNEDILYEKWGTKPYGKVTEQHSKLQKAVKIDRESALMSASWGRFQIMGYHWLPLGYSSLQSFINAMYQSEDEHLKAFIKYVEVNKLTKHLKSKNWIKFAEGYNGSGYAQNKYPEKLEKAYKKYAQS
jgi:hypothetical protein